LEVPYLLDLRGAWSQWCVAPYRSYWHYRKLLREERACLKAAVTTMATTPQTAKALEELHFTATQKKVNVIPNGYERKMEWPKVINVPPLAARDQLVIGYVGSFYYSPAARANMLRPWYKKPPHKALQYVPHKEDWLYRSPYFFFKTLRALLDEQPAYAEKLRIEFVGHHHDWLEAMLQEFDLKSIFKSHGFVSNKRALEIQANFDLFLGTSAKIHGKADYSMGSKYYEYIRFGQPILGFTPNGVLKDFLEESGMGIIANPDDLTGAKSIVNKVIEGGFKLYPNSKYLDKFYLDSIARQLVTSIHNLIEL